MTVKRDRFIDFCKGFLILWVIHLHTVYFSGWGYISDNIRQWSLLIDVPAFFFISGYLTKVVDCNTSVKKCAKQFWYLYSNYLFLSCLLLVPLYLFELFKARNFPDLQLAITSMLKVNQTGNVWDNFPAYQGSLWYLAVYLSILLFVPLAISLFATQKSRTIVLILIFLFFVCSRYLNLNYDFLLTQTSYIFFYLFIYMLGVAYRIDEKNIRIGHLKLTFFLNLTLCIIIFFYVDHSTIQLRSYKFPPSFEYLTYSLILIHVIAIAKRIWHYPTQNLTNKAFQLLEWCGINVYFIYLFQGVACSLTGFLISLIKNHVSVLILYLIVLILNICITVVLTFLYLKVKTNFSNLIVKNIGNRNVPY